MKYKKEAERLLEEYYLVPLTVDEVAEKMETVSKTEVCKESGKEPEEIIANTLQIRHKKEKDKNENEFKGIKMESPADKYPTQRIS